MPVLEFLLVITVMICLESIYKYVHIYYMYSNIYMNIYEYMYVYVRILPTPPREDMTQGQFLSLTGLNLEFSF